MIEITGYKLIKELGKGGMATVYLAIHELLDREVALKVHKFGASDPAFRDSFVKEGQVVAKLEHPHIVKIYDIGTEDHRFYMAMEYIKEGTLKDKLNQSVLSTDEILAVIDQTAQALFYAHEKGYIHRDIKPANILFRKKNDVVLADFGIAKLQGTESDLTQIGYLSGTPSYMSPEQSMGGEVDARTDQYSLGVVLYEMLTGRKPFQGDNTMAVTYKHAHEEVPKLPLAYSGIQSVLDKALAKDKEDRYVDVMSFSQALNEAFLNEGDDRTVIRPVRQSVTGSGESSLAPEQVEMIRQDIQEGRFKSVHSTSTVNDNVGSHEGKSKLVPVLLSLLLAMGLVGAGYVYMTNNAQNDAKEIAEEERIAEEKAKEERIAKEKAEKDRIAKEAEEDRIAKEKAKEERIAKEKAEEERIAREKALKLKKWKLSLSSKVEKKRVKASYIIKKNKKMLKKTKSKIKHSERLLEGNYTVTASYLGTAQSKDIRVRTNNSNQLTFSFKSKNDVPSQPTKDSNNSVLNPDTRIPIPPGFKGLILINGARKKGSNKDIPIRANCKIGSKKINIRGIIEYIDLPDGQHTIACSFNGKSCRDTITLQSDYGKVICDFSSKKTKKPPAANKPTAANEGTLKLLATIDGKNHPTGFIINQGKKRIKVVSGAPAEISLPPGRYSITAIYNGKTIPRGANLKAGKTLSFTFPFKSNEKTPPSNISTTNADQQQSIDEASPPPPDKLF